MKGNAVKDVNGKHLHIRGENVGQLFAMDDEAETPPHTWRKSKRNSTMNQHNRNTSTYVEKMTP